MHGALFSQPILFIFTDLDSVVPIANSTSASCNDVTCGHACDVITGSCLCKRGYALTDDDTTCQGDSFILSDIPLIRK